MRKRTPIVLAVVVVIAVAMFLARRPDFSQEALPPQAARETVPGDDAPPAPIETGTSRETSARPGSTVPPSGKPPVSETAPGDSAGPEANPFPANKPMVVGSRTFVPKAPPPTPEPQAAIELDKVRLMLRDYRTLYHENPVGTNAEIMKAVMGGNPKQAQLGPPEGQSMSADGQVVDRWGTPYFFHQLSSDLMEIRSAGPDKTLWTSDDIVTK